MQKELCTCMCFFIAISERAEKAVENCGAKVDPLTEKFKIDWPINTFFRGPLHLNGADSRVRVQYILCLIVASAARAPIFTSSYEWVFG